jgi:hypothetical protein
MQRVRQGVCEALGADGAHALAHGRCPHCPHAAASASALQTHIRTHTGERPHQCPHCPYAAARAGNLKGHIRTHTGERPYLCSACGEAFAYLRTAKRHVARCQHGQEATEIASTSEGAAAAASEYVGAEHHLFSCSWCSELLVSAVELRDHERGHGTFPSWLPLLPFGCGSLSPAFAPLAELEAHQAAEEENDDDCSPGGFADAACSFCFEEFTMVSQAQACERAHVAAVPTGSVQGEAGRGRRRRRGGRGGL